MKPEEITALTGSRGFASRRIEWFHERVEKGSYPNASRLCERFGISKSQAQRDVRLLRTIGAPLRYDAAREGFEYTGPFELPPFLILDGAESTVSAIASAESDAGGVQITIPYTARVRLPDKMSAVELGKYVKGRPKGGVYDCEFRNPELFIGMLVAAAPGAEIISPEWLRDKLVERCSAMLGSNAPEEK